MANSTVVSYPSSPVLVPIRSQTDKGTEQRSLRELIEGRCVSLFDDFKPVWWLNKHVRCLMFIQASS